LANQKGIDVFWLQGEYQWLDDSSKLLEKLEKYNRYQTENPNCKFAGIHLDIEPHQNPEFGVKRAELIHELIDLAYNLKITYPNIKFDYDIPFWLDDNIQFNNQVKPAYQHMIDIADRVFVMSYRDSAAAIRDIAKDELEYAKSIGKKIILSVETYSTEGDKVSFLEEGKIKMMAELQTLKEEFGDSIGLSIHHIKTWYDLKD